jgi:putative hydrolase of the HAD superfamily
LSKLDPDISKIISLELLIKNRDQWMDLILQIEPKNFTISRDLLLENYRSHQPSIELYEDASKLLSFLVENKAKLAMITDGRSSSQRQKLKSLTIEYLFSPILISEETGYPKPNSDSYLAIESRYPNHQYLYVGDNPMKDFLTPNKLGWMTYGLKDRGQNVHSQNIELVSKEYLPKIWLDSHIDLVPRIII